MMMSVDPAYWPTCAWYFNAQQLVTLRGLVDNNNRPLFNFANGMDGVYGDEGETNRLDTGSPSSSAPVNSPVGRMLGFPVFVDNSIPALTASTTGGPIFGSMEHAMVMRTVGNGARVMRLTERYADFLAAALYCFARFDLRSNDLRSAATLKPAAT
jgi:hypothetical protein